MYDKQVQKRTYGAKVLKNLGKNDGAGAHVSFLSYNFSLKCCPTFPKLLLFFAADEVKDRGETFTTRSSRGKRESYVMLNGSSKKIKEINKSCGFQRIKCVHRFHCKSCFKIFAAD